MSEPEEQIQKIIRLKRYEKPRDGYFEDFLEEFQERQRGEILHQSSRSLLVERADTWLRQVGVMKWLVGFGAAYAIVMIGMVMWSPKGGHDKKPKPNLSPATHEPSGKPPIKPDGSSPKEENEPLPKQDF